MNTRNFVGGIWSYPTQTRVRLAVALAVGAKKSDRTRKLSVSHAFMYFLFAAMLPLTLASCATNGPLRSATLAWDGSTVLPRPPECNDSYFNTDNLIWQELHNPSTTVDSREALNEKVDKIISPELNDPDIRISRCWRSSYEDHQGLKPPQGYVAGSNGPPLGYDLFVSEFDDQGERTDVSRAQVTFQRSEVALIESRLESLLADELHKSPNGGLNVVIFAHGWHGSASATDDYSVWFKAILEEITSLEATSRRSVCAAARRELGVAADPATRNRLRAQLSSYACSVSNPDDQGSFARRRTVGIEIAWRGDSETVPLFTWANFWDRKDAAQTVAKGGVYDLLARLHAFYIAHSCHTPEAIMTPKGEQCDVVHLLTVGHSFGALIAYHTLNSDLSTGLLGDSIGRAYGFGDLTVLLNPAFEGEREITLMDASLNRDGYPRKIVGLKAAQSGAAAVWPPGAQMPTLVTLQSKGDWATHYLFPIARALTGIFDNTPGSGEYVRSLKASGWIRSYQTHRLSVGTPYTKDICDSSDAPPIWFCPFDTSHEGTQPQPLILQWQGRTDRPAYLPVWTIAVDKSIMSNHDDISNPAIIRFVAQLFRVAYEQSELIHEVARQSVPPRKGAKQ